MNLIYKLFIILLLLLLLYTAAISPATPSRGADTRRRRRGGSRPTLPHTARNRTRELRINLSVACILYYILVRVCSLPILLLSYIYTYYMRVHSLRACECVPR